MLEPEAEAEEAEAKAEPQEEDRQVVPESEEELASLTNVIKRKSWQERFGAIEIDTDGTPVKEKQETGKQKKKKVITDLSQLDSIKFNLMMRNR